MSGGRFASLLLFDRYQVLEVRPGEFHIIDHTKLKEDWRDDWKATLRHPARGEAMGDAMTFPNRVAAEDHVESLIDGTARTTPRVRKVRNRKKRVRKKKV